MRSKNIPMILLVGFVGFCLVMAFADASTHTITNLPAAPTTSLSNSSELAAAPTTSLNSSNSSELDCLEGFMPENKWGYTYPQFMQVVSCTKSCGATPVCLSDCMASTDHVVIVQGTLANVCRVIQVPGQLFTYIESGPYHDQKFVMITDDLQAH